MSKSCQGTTNSDSQIKLAQLQVERIKEEEEQWISGEELYTEGSSDDDDAALRAKRRHDERQGRVPKRIPKAAASSRNKNNLQEQMVLPTGQCGGALLPHNVQSEPETLNIAGVAAEAHSCDAQQAFPSENDGCDLLVEIDDSEISWRPKRDTELGRQERDGSVNVSSADEETIGRITTMGNTGILTTKISSQEITSSYAISEEIAALLQGINMKLKVFSDDEYDIEEFSQDESRLHEFSEAREKLTLINKQLDEIEILARKEKSYPLEEEQMEDLIQKSCLSLKRSQPVHLPTSTSFENKTVLQKPQNENLLYSLQQESLERILQEANVEMPHFQYKYIQK